MKLTATTKDAYNLLHEGLLAHADIERDGMMVDVDYCERVKGELTERIKKAEGQLKGTKFFKHWQHTSKSRVNINSNPQLAHFLYGVKKIQPLKLTATGKGSTDEEALSQLGIPEVELILQMRKLKKIRDTYIDSFLREQVDGVVHPFFNLHIARSYRPSSNSPNFQNIPIRDEEAMEICRRAIIPRPGNQLLDTDYSGIEVLMACCYTQDEQLIYDAINGDMHRDMAIELYMLDGLNKGHKGESILRQGAKNGFVFPQFYGDYYGNCTPNLIGHARVGYLHDGTPALEHLESKGLIKRNAKGEVTNIDKFTNHVQNIEDQFWNVRYRTYTKWKDKIWKRYQTRGYIELLTGFRCGGVMTKKQVNNTPIQGAAFHCLLWSLIRINEIRKGEGWESKIIGQIHDDIVSDVVPKELNHVAETIERVTCKDLLKEWDWLIVPLKVEMELCGVDQPWSTKKGWDGGIIS